MLPILESELQKIGKPIFGEYVLILIQHLLRDTISLIEAFADAGAEPSDMFIIGIPYSSKANIVKELKKTFKVFTPSFPIDEKVIDVVEQAVEVCKEKDKKLLIIEDGGYAVPIIQGWIIQTRKDGGYIKVPIPKKFDEILEYCYGAVEQTAQGVWRDKEIELKIPVVTIASSKLKRVLEAPEVGNAVVRNTQELLSQRGEFIRGRNVALIGYGTIGSEIAKALRNNGAVVTVADIDLINLVGARFGGFYTDSRMNFISRSNIIIGATGRCSIGKKAILKISESGKDVVLVNASSKRVEIDVDILEDLKETKIATKIGTDYQMPEGNKILLLAEGYPVNFYGGSESIPDGIIDVILTELFLCAKKLVTEDFSPGIYETGVIDEDELAKLFHSLYFSR
jgi:adenosylhomocysteinase